MEIHQLRYLRAVVRTGSVTAAAAAEHVAQPSISKQLRLLERELGTSSSTVSAPRRAPAALHLADSADRIIRSSPPPLLLLQGRRPPLPQVYLCATETAADQLVPPPSLASCATGRTPA
jgi:DNA-binding transcriptional LysR family regulator